jgi:Lipocalin-like domain
MIVAHLKRLALASIAAAFAVIHTSGVFAQSAANDVVGTWQLVSNVVTTAGKKTDQFGPNPHGILYFERNGHYVLSIMRDGLPKFAGKGRMHGTDAEDKAIVQGSISHFGTYEVEDGKIVFHVAYSTLPNWDGTTSKRPFKISGDELSFFVPSASAGAGSSSVVKWKRQK